MVALFAWGVIVLAFSVGGLADVTSLWWLVPLFGLAAPVALLAVRYRVFRDGGIAAAGDGERDLLVALREHGELTPTAAAVLTSLTAGEAAKTLERLAREGHLEARVKEGTICYAMREGDRRVVSGARSEPLAGHPDQAAASPTRAKKPLADALTDRERAVLKLLAAGQTNKEIADELFVAEGTIKAHVAGVYRKLGAHSRAEAVAKAADRNLL